MSITKNELLARTELMLGDGATERLGATRVAIFGIGGVGGYALEALMRTGVGHIDVIDADEVSPSNVNRQILASAVTVGERKTECAKKRAEDIGLGTEIGCYDLFYSEETEGEIDLSKYDYIIDAIDTVPSKCLLIKNATALGVPIISSMGTGGKLDPTALKVADISKTHTCPLARTMRSELKKLGIKHLKVVFSDEEPIKRTFADDVQGIYTRRVPGSVIFVPAAAGLTLAAEVVKDLLAGEVSEK